MVSSGSRTPQGRGGRSLILTGLGFVLIGVLFSASSYVIGGGRYNGYHSISWWPIAIGLLTMARGTFKAIGDRRARKTGLGQGTVPGDQPVPYYSQEQQEQQDPAGEHPGYDQPGYGMPRNPGRPRDPGRPPGA